MWGWMRSWFGRDGGSRAELDEEMAFHLDRLTANQPPPRRIDADG